MKARGTRRKRGAIVVEVLGQELDPARITEREETERWARAGLLLRHYDFARYRRVFALAEAFVATHVVQESDDVHALRSAVISGDARSVN